MIIFFIGISIGILVCKSIDIFKNIKNNIGILRIDRSDEDGPYLFLELKKDISSFSNKKIITMFVKNENFISENDNIK